MDSTVKRTRTKTQTQTPAATVKELEPLRDKGFLINPLLEQSGLACPKGYKLTKVNLDYVKDMEWDPIGIWEPTQTLVLRLTKSPCRLALGFADGSQMFFAFRENDFRYIVDSKWLVVYSQEKARRSAKG